MRKNKWNIYFGQALATVPRDLVMLCLQQAKLSSQLVWNLYGETVWMWHSERPERNGVRVSCKPVGG